MITSRNKNIFFFVLAAVAWCLYICKQKGTYYSFVSGYGNDLLFIPLLSWVSEKIMFFIYGPVFTMKWIHIAASVVFTAVFFEMIVPYYNCRYTADVADVFCYTVGGILYFLFFLPAKTEQAI